MVVDQLANDYAGQPVVFIEYNVDDPPLVRYGRWWAAHGGGGSVSLPLSMVDSGYQFMSGYNANIYNDYKAMLDAALARPPQAEIQATWQRTGDHVTLDIQVTNLTTETLSTANAATLHAIVYEENHVQLTGRFGRAVVNTGITALAPNATAEFTLATADLTGVDWARLHYIVLVDYVPPGATAYDMLQAAVALPVASNHLYLPAVMR